MIHPLADCRSNSIPDSTNVWQFCVVMAQAVIGENCNLCANVLVENKVKIGNNCTVKCGVQLWDGVTLEDNVFVGPNATFTNDLVPRSKASDYIQRTTIVRRGASIGANATIVAGIEIGEYALIGAGAVVTKNIPPHTVWYGNPATQRGYITADGTLLDMNKQDKTGGTHL